MKEGSNLDLLFIVWHSFNMMQVGFIGLVEEEWLVTLATVDREEVTYLDFVTEGTKLAKQLREEVIIFLLKYDNNQSLQMIFL